MKKTLHLIVILLIFISLVLLSGCSQSYECEIWQYDGGWAYYTWDTYNGTSESDADANCENDWGSAYDCRNCVPY
ncbi:MAG: hypothetical protein KAH95_09780 [Spirochaetales bacterium]|nr:hypothetical protein [Spirochaetales bacterium]